MDKEGTGQLQDEVDHDRRDWMLLTLMGVSTAALGGIRPAVAATRSSEGKTNAHLVTKKLGEAVSRIPGFSKVILATLTYQPGDRVRFKMDTPAICQVTEGKLEAKRAGEFFIADTGYIWTCNTGDECESVNKGPGIAVMRYFSLIPG